MNFAHEQLVSKSPFDLSVASMLSYRAFSWSAETIDHSSSFEVDDRIALICVKTDILSSDNDSLPINSHNDDAIAAIDL